MFRAIQPRITSIVMASFRFNGSQAGEWGSGAGKGGGAGGSVREAGGSFGKMEAAREEEYFRKLQRQQILKLKECLLKDIKTHEDAIERLKAEIKWHEEQIAKLKVLEK